jgi:hypothetical protein
MEPRIQYARTADVVGIAFWTWTKGRRRNVGTKERDHE